MQNTNPFNLSAEELELACRPQEDICECCLKNKAEKDDYMCSQCISDMLISMENSEK